MATDILNEEAVRLHAQATCDALVAGAVDRFVDDLSDELRRNAGEVIGLLPLPVTQASVASVDQNGHAFVVGLELTGEAETVELQTRWKERDGRPTIVEVSHASRTAVPALESESVADPGEATSGD
ncbi:MAG TPA: hypothetical protein VFX65_02625 [Candidatus Limnocylindrales bacterium]|nr:hypothetical protein [Candidatus Limnocylindrales bacterium]